jgi:hypothetical protein
MKWEAKTVAELRLAAKQRGFRGYSQWTKDQLVRALKAHQATEASAPAMKQEQPAPSDAKQSAPRTPPPAAPPTETPGRNGEQQRIEDAKFLSTAPGIALHEPDFTLSLEESIDVLPPLLAPTLSLLLQKPGVLHAYWVLDAGMLTRRPTLHLRLSRVTNDTVELLEETRVPSERGHWYFHVDDRLDPADFYLQLGQYGEHGQFTTALPRGIVRMPRLAASSEMDRQWWVSEERFREMYTRAGGVMREGQLRWPARSSFSSNR